MGIVTKLWLTKNCHHAEQDGFWKGLAPVGIADPAARKAQPCPLKILWRCGLISICYWQYRACDTQGGGLRHSSSQFVTGQTAETPMGNQGVAVR